MVSQNEGEGERRERETDILNFSASDRNFADLWTQLIRRAHPREYGTSLFPTRSNPNLKLRGTKWRNQHGRIFDIPYSFSKNSLKNINSPIYTCTYIDIYIYYTCIAILSVRSSTTKKQRNFSRYPYTICVAGCRYKKWQKRNAKKCKKKIKIRNFQI